MIARMKSLFTSMAIAFVVLVACNPGDRTTSATNPPDAPENKSKAGATECIRNSCDKEATKTKCCTNGSQTWCCLSTQECDTTVAGCK
jgi:hypothetical protein